MTSKRAAVGLGVLAMALVGNSVAVSGLLGHGPLMTAQAVRYVVAAGLLTAGARVAGVRVRRPRGAEWLWLTGVAATGLVLFNMAVVRGTAHAEPAVIAVAVACVPVLLGVFGPLLQRARPTGAGLLAAVVVTVGGVLVEGSGRTDAAGIGWALVALACEAAFTLLAVPVLGRHGAIGVSVHSVWLGAVMFAVLGILTEGPAAAAELGPAQWGAVAYLAVLVTAVAFVCWYSAVSRLGPGTAGVMTGVAPVAAAVGGMVIGGVIPGTLVWLGIAVVGLGLGIGLAGSLGADRGRHAPLSPVGNVRE